MLFHEIYGSYYQAVAMILRRAVQGSLTMRDLHALIRENAFGESALTIPEGLTGGEWKLLNRDLTTPIQNEPVMPLTVLEKRWLRALLLDPRIRLFAPEIQALEEGLSDVEPLFTPDMVVYYDRYTDGDDYSDPAYVERFRTILGALREKKDLYIRFETGAGANREMVLTPYFLEYSDKEDRFRLVAAGRRRNWTINLSRISFCTPARGNTGFPFRETDMCQVTFELQDRWNALRRVMTHFAHLEKETVALGDGHYRVTLRYDPADEMEMVIRILSFGSVIRVTEPEAFIGKIRERIEKQAALFRERKGE